MRQIILSTIFILLAMTAYSQQNSNNDALLGPVKQQLEAYNNRDIERFASAFSKDVKVYRQPGILTYEGREELRKRYGAMFAATPDLHCEVVNRIISGEVVIDQEKVQRTKGQPRTDAIAVYRVKDGLIVEVTFLPPYSN